MEFKLDGKLYKIGCSLKLLMDNGWETPYFTGTSINSGDYYLFLDIVKNQMVTRICVGNYTDESDEVHNAKLNFFSANSYLVPNFEMANGITWGCTIDEVISTYGEPTETYGEDVLSYDFNYQTDADGNITNDYITFTFGEDGTLSEVQIQGYSQYHY